MSELTLLVLRLAFLLLLWVFVFIVVFTLRSDLFGPRVRRPDAAAGTAGAGTFPTEPTSGTAPTAAVASVAAAPAAAASAAHPSPPLPSERTARRIIITSGPKEGLEIDLPNDQFSIGRSSESGLVIRDDYTSTHHARLMLWNDQWVVQDLDSTNGTFIAGTRVHLPTPVPLNTPVSIGQTTFELRR